ncbi:MAG: hypothetical protein JSU92_05400 [Deltaproteobacteria bacterium]|nr:MAG: hypothetical protein JSU92_05400 [Deltaproteobacteria bacterium]
MSEEEILVLGSHFLGLLKYTGEKLGAEGRGNLLKSLDYEDRAVFCKSADCSEAKKISMTEWYSYKAFKNFLNAVIKEIGKGDVNLARDIGHWGAEKDLDPKKGLLKFYTKDAYKGDRTVLHRATPVIWSQAYNKGKIEVETIEIGKETKLKLTGFPEVIEACCLLIAGWIERASQIVSGFNLRIEIKFKPTPDLDCEFTMFQD